LELGLNHDLVTHVQRSNGLNDHLVSRVHRETLTCLGVLLHYFVVVELLVALLGSEDIEVHVVVQIVLSIDFDLRLRSVHVTLLLFQLSFGVLFLSVRNLLGGLGHRVEADCQSTTAETAAHNQHKHDKDANQAIPGRSVKVDRKFVAHSYC
jgi:hypothetical protein